MKDQVCICVAGWHFQPAFYKRLDAMEVDTFVVSHRPPSQIPQEILTLNISGRILYTPNIGYDWGCYQQFIERDLWQDYAAVIFMHDDLTITNAGFVRAVEAFFSRGALVVGNGRNSTHTAWPATHLQCYAHSFWHPPGLDFTHQTVRGSFFAIQSKAISAMQHFEVFWDPYHIQIRFGNHSMIATCGKLQDLFGQDGFAFLGEDYRQSIYLQEKERGGEGVRPGISLLQRVITVLYNRLGRQVVLASYSPPKNQFSKFRITQYQRILAAIHGVKGNQSSL